MNAKVSVVLFLPISLHCDEKKEVKISLFTILIVEIASIGGYIVVQSPVARADRPMAGDREGGWGVGRCTRCTQRNTIS